MDVFVIVVAAGKVMYKSKSSSAFGIGGRSQKQRSVCSLKRVRLFRSPIVNVLKRVKVGKALESIFFATVFVLWVAVGLPWWQVVSQAVSDRTQDVLPPHVHKY
jgi:hypothetical protein